MTACTLPASASHANVKASNFALQDYFERIGYRGEPAADLATLTELMRHQLFAIPFENLDVQAGRIVSLVPEEIVEKLLKRNRGGYCYEVNGLFCMALGALGIACRFVAARPMFYPVRRPKTHMALVVTVDGRDWLCDLGFGSYGIRQPMALDVLDVEVAQDDDRFLLTRSGHEFVLRALVGGEWVDQYGFDLSPQEWIDFMPANYLNSTHPEAIFVQKLLVVRHTPAGRAILFGDTLKTVSHGEVSQRTLAAQERDQVLASVFGLDPVR